MTSEKTGQFADPIRSLGFRSDLLIHRFSAEVLDRGNYLVVRSPQQQGYYWGNLLYFPDAPAHGDYERWEALFVQEFADLPDVRHRTYAWDTTTGEPGAVEPFLRRGFHIDVSEVMTAAEVLKPRYYNELLSCRPLRSHEDWEQASVASALVNDEGFPQEEFEHYVRKQMASFRAMVHAGLGDWWGAFEGETLLGSLGLFFGGGLGRYQSVSTHPEHRRKGVCSTLMFHAASTALEQGRATTLVLVADSKGPAFRIYQSLGFAVREQCAGICRYPHRQSAEQC